MGKGTLEAPDAVESPATGATGQASADDLLAQIAGEEIDRLLAEADVEPEDSATSQSTPPAASAPIDLPIAESITAAPPLAPTAPTAALDVTPQLDELFNQLVEGDEEPEPPTKLPSGGESSVVAVPTAVINAVPELDPAPPEPPAALPLTAPPESANKKSPVANMDVPGSMVAEVMANAETATSLAERSALDLTSEPAAAADLESDTPTDEAPPFYMRLLERVCAPLEACPDPVRNVLGKIALLTLFNSAAVLIYIHFFRKH